ncbi:hypothetical protein ACFY71_02660 [Streptomyces cinerochromogenes]|uniref:hypothetical protein n=1 Tax=Streptomyces cinerochromogenes TaxID=66422 RepID=UPI0036A62B9F
MRMNDRMRILMGAELPSVRSDDAPPAYRAIAEEGWTVTANGACLLSVLADGYSGTSTEFGDIVHFEASVNGRAMMEYDLPAVGSERQNRLLRRSIAYACLALQAVPEGNEHPVFGYVSLSEGGLMGDTLTSNVTFCTRRPDVPPYVGRIQDYAYEALLELSGGDAEKCLSGHTV